jgi:hypothetical protein
MTPRPQLLQVALSESDINYPPYFISKKWTLASGKHGTPGKRSDAGLLWQGAEIVIKRRSDLGLNTTSASTTI